MINQITASTRYRDIDHHSSSGSDDKKFNECNTSRVRRNESPESIENHNRDRHFLDRTGGQLILLNDKSRDSHRPFESEIAIDISRDQKDDVRIRVNHKSSAKKQAPIEISKNDHDGDKHADKSEEVKPTDRLPS